MQISALLRWRHFRFSLSVSLSLSLSAPHWQYRKRFRASYNTVQDLGLLSSFFFFAIDAETWRWHSEGGRAPAFLPSAWSSEQIHAIKPLDASSRVRERERERERGMICSFAKWRMTVLQHCPWSAVPSGRRTQVCSTVSSPTTRFSLCGD